MAAVNVGRGREVGGCLVNIIAGIAYTGGSQRGGKHSERGLVVVGVVTVGRGRGSGRGEGGWRKGWRGGSLCCPTLRVVTENKRHRGHN